MRFRFPARILPAALLLGSSLGLNGTAHAANQPICFPEAAPVITACIEGRFAEYWQKNGGLAVFGYPITEARDEVNADTGETYRTQYFERQRFELHTENKAPYDVLMGRLGDDRLRPWASIGNPCPRATRRPRTTRPKLDMRSAKNFGRTTAAMALTSVIRA